MKERKSNFIVALTVNILMVYVAYTICRLEFFFENSSMFPTSAGSGHWWSMMMGGLRFDTSAICYTNILYVLFALIPWKKKENTVYYKVLKWLYLIVNAVCIAMNLCDSVYYPYSFHRVTSQVFNEFGNNDNLGNIFGIEFVHHWYLVLLFAVMMLAMWRMYQNPMQKNATETKRSYYLVRISVLILVVMFSIFGMRGSFGYTAMRPINVGTAFQYTTQSSETSILLNTPFSLIRTMDKRLATPPVFFKSQAELDAIYNPVHEPVDSIAPKKKNVVILIIESFAKEFIGGLNKDLDNGTYKGYTPFVDSFIPKCMTFERTFCNTNTSIDAMPAVLASIPKLETAFVGTPYALDHIQGIAGALDQWEYQSAFFHGAPDGSMGFDAFAQQAGFDKYYGKEEYAQDPRFHGDKDFDGTWAIWDEEFLQYYALKMSEMKEPFVTACFTASSHHPFKIPERYKDVFLDEGLYPLHKCIKYTDYSIKRFFETAKKQPWYENTIFVLTADHASSRTTHDIYKTELGNCMVPILIFDPSGDIKPGKRKGMMSQFDIMPSLLGYLGYDKPFVAFGRNVFNPKEGQGFGFNWHHIPLFIYGDYVLQADVNANVISLNNYAKDPLLKHNLEGKKSKEIDDVMLHFKAFMQSFLGRLDKDEMRVSRPPRLK